MEITKKSDSEVWEIIHVLEDRMCLLKKFIVKVTHSTATTLNLIKDMEGDLP